jgi:hypothetical protein
MVGVAPTVDVMTTAPGRSALVRAAAAELLLAVNPDSSVVSAIGGHHHCEHLRAPDAGHAGADCGSDGRHPDPSKASDRRLKLVQAVVQKQTETPGGHPSGVNSCVIWW